MLIYGVLERENNIAYDEETSKPIDIANSNTSPMAITNRVLISSLLGGYNDFNSSINKIKSLEIKMIIILYTESALQEQIENIEMFY